MKTTCILLAAGESRRMGKPNKLLLPLAEKAIAIHVRDALVACAKIDELIIVLGHEKDLVFSTLQHTKATFVENKRFREGLTSSIQTGIVAANDSDAYIICLSDQPYLRSDDIEILINAFAKSYQTDEKTIIIPVFKEERGNPVIFSKYYKDLILQHNEPNGCKSIVQNHKNHVKLIETPTNAILIDIDTPKDYNETELSQIL